MSSHNLCFSKIRKNNVYPCKSQFYCIKWGIRWSKLYRYVLVMEDSFCVTVFALIVPTGQSKQSKPRSDSTECGI